MPNSVSKFVFDKVGIPKFRTYLSLSSFRQKLTAGNMANLSTPGYEAKGIDFQDEFARMTTKKSQLEGTRTHQYHIPLGHSQAKGPSVNSTDVKEGEMNSVDIDTEMANMVQNELQYTTSAQLVRSRFESLRKAITSN